MPKPNPLVVSLSNHASAALASFDRLRTSGGVGHG